MGVLLTLAALLLQVLHYWHLLPHWKTNQMLDLAAYNQDFLVYSMEFFKSVPFFFWVYNACANIFHNSFSILYLYLYNLLLSCQRNTGGPHYPQGNGSIGTKARRKRNINQLHIHFVLLITKSFIKLVRLCHSLTGYGEWWWPSREHLGLDSIGIYCRIVFSPRQNLHSYSPTWAADQTSAAKQGISIYV